MELGEGAAGGRGKEAPVNQAEANVLHAFLWRPPLPSVPPSAGSSR